MSLYSYICVMENSLLSHNRELANVLECESLITSKSYKVKILVDALRLVSADKDISEGKLIIPDNCEQYGFVEGNHNLGILLHFLADMLEE